MVIRHLPLNENGYLAGLAIPKGLEPLLELFLDNLNKGNAKAKESAADGFGMFALFRFASCQPLLTRCLGMLVVRSDPAALKPYILKIAGPLIRVYQENYPRVRAAILETICITLKHVGVDFKPFVPQVQVRVALNKPGNV